MNEWYPIETALTNMECLLVWSPDSESRPADCVEIAWREHGTWVDEHGIINPQPTHWRHLPAPPTKMVQDPAPPLPESER